MPATTIIPVLILKHIEIYSGSLSALQCTQIYIYARISNLVFLQSQVLTPKFDREKKTPQKELQCIVLKMLRHSYKFYTIMTFTNLQ